MSDKLISANNLMDYINSSINEMTEIGITVDGEYLWGLINDAIDNASAIDAVEVVRCEDCKYGREVRGIIECSVDLNSPTKYHGYEWFCPSGQRREVDKRMKSVEEND